MSPTPPLEETTELHRPGAVPGRRAPTAQFALVLMWSATEPARVGEVVRVPPGDPVLLGRAGPSLVRPRPGETRDTGPLNGRRLSRQHLRLQVVGRRLQVENLGRLPLQVDGEPREQAVVEAGALIALAGEALFRVALRPPRLEPLSTGYEPDFAWGAPDPDGLVGECPATFALRDRLAFVGPRAGHVLVLGRSGTGKELAARALHRHAGHPEAPFVARNAATLPASLVDAELFGHARDYPQSGMPARPGLVGEAQGGTLFLDEIGELPTGLQAHLLRLLDGGEYQRLGETGSRRADLRLVAATNREREALKHDLLARFRHVVEVPDLDARRDDVPLLVRHLLRAAAAEDALIARRFVDADGEPRVSAELIVALLRHPLPLQVRQLDTLLWRCLSESAGGVVEPVPELLAAAEEAEAPGEEARDPRTVTRTEIEVALATHHGVQNRVWRALGLQNRYVLRRLMHKFGIESGAEDAGDST